jgi:hypothetical protein
MGNTMGNTIHVNKNESVVDALARYGMEYSCGYIRFRGDVDIAHDDLVVEISDDDRCGPAAAERRLNIFQEAAAAKEITKLQSATEETILLSAVEKGYTIYDAPSHYPSHGCRIGGSKTTDGPDCWMDAANVTLWKHQNGIRDKI